MLRTGRVDLRETADANTSAVAGLKSGINLYTSVLFDIIADTAHITRLSAPRPPGPIR